MIMRRKEGKSLFCHICFNRLLKPIEKRAVEDGYQRQLKLFFTHCQPKHSKLCYPKCHSHCCLKLHIWTWRGRANCHRKYNIVLSGNGSLPLFTTGYAVTIILSLSTNEKMWRLVKGLSTCRTHRVFAKKKMQLSKRTLPSYFTKPHLRVGAAAKKICQNQLLLPLSKNQCKKEPEGNSLRCLFLCISRTASEWCSEALYLSLPLYF